MNITETVKCSLRYVATAGVVMTAFSLASCSDDEEEEYVEKHSEYLNFYPNDDDEGTIEYPNDIQKIMDADYIADLLKRDDVDTVYFRACGGNEWRKKTAVSVVINSRAIKEFSQQNPSRIRGTGEMNFKLGEASMVPADSAWLANFGFSINANLNK